MDGTDFGANRVAAPLGLGEIERPGPLARAAWRAARGLLGRPGGGGRATFAIARLAAIEARHEEARRARAPGYRPSRHVAALAALIAASAQPKASGSPAFRSAI